ncbi:ABC transporter ATP-binding protein/permease [Actinoplanes bogorensis]|uniref:ABC transporter ATP-binding protein/permease n=1 Tax=Paractinoplanes bogorensis TaxID=1610840 RepID=A0ABS5YJL6_9ACTN|nr:ABC transporter ATP-binding protein [Actinoplanes bogorensis]MBU2663593.1 ABC transporter ATP-binding protein/permease [Actinoplanes bogorensis]
MSERTLLPVATAAQTWSAVRALLRPRRGLAVLAIAVLTAGTAIGLVTVRLLGHIVDLVTEGRPADAITAPVVALVLVAIGQAVASGFGLTLVARLGEGMLAELRERFVDRVLALPLDQVEEAGTGDLTSRVTNDVTAIATAVRSALPELARSVLTIALTLVGLVVLDWRFLLAALIAVPIQLHTVRWYSGRALPLYARQRVSVGSMQQQLQETVGGSGTVRALRLQERHHGLVRGRSLDAVDWTMRGVRVLTQFYARLNLAEFVGLAAVLVTGFLLVRDGSATIGTATVAALYFHGLFVPINTALGLVDDAQAAGASLVRLVGVTSMPAPPEQNAQISERATIEVEKVEHAYQPDQPVLRGVSLEVAAGERVALVGASGAGKTTLAGLIAGVRTPDGGTIRLGGTPIDELDVRRTVVILSQEVHVFAGPLADDLRLARPDATDDQLSVALTRVGAADWVAALPDGLGTVVGHGGHRLTVTQAQQLALARLVLIDPPIAVLDEATAEAGSAGARLLEAAVEEALAGRTGIVVAHRLAQAVTADRVVLLDAGRILETGTHAELAARPDGHYAKLWKAWADHRPGC